MNIPRFFLLALFVALGGSRATAAAAVALQPVEVKMPPLPAGVFEINQVTRPPAPMRQVGPVHPPVLMKARVGGEVHVLFTVKADGAVTDVLIIKAADVRLGEAVREAVTTWRYRPAQLRGKPVACRLVVPVTFSTPVEEK